MLSQVKVLVPGFLCKSSNYSSANQDVLGSRPPDHWGSGRLGRAALEATAAAAAASVWVQPCPRGLHGVAAVPSGKLVPCLVPANPWPCTSYALDGSPPGASRTETAEPRPPSPPPAIRTRRRQRFTARPLLAPRVSQSRSATARPATTWWRRLGRMPPTSLWATSIRERGRTCQC